MLLNSAVFLFWHPRIQCRLQPEANSSGVPPGPALSAYPPSVGCSAEHHATGNAANTGVTSTVQVRIRRRVMRRPIRAGTYGTLCSIRLVEYDAATNAAVTDISTNNAGPDQALQYAAPRQGRH